MLFIDHVSRFNDGRAASRPPKFNSKPPREQEFMT